ncbi:S8 family serine peptidase [Primorskyibacter aestuariivivens]|uniref:S8 family serine peptidase n=1 Tax=Primorskyibacter aestuariivivens TaxID=1888912 RepID=UPI002300741D|nr:S8 family serine peptidase [Primorskyibacter aestuariivivens]MDA7430137.1 S8 family serine peptidase [Primorskyibacter aestuariivivens]
MKRHSLTIAAVCFSIFTSPALAQGRGNSGETLEQLVANSYIVRLPDGLSGEDVRGKARGAAVRFNGTLRHVYTGGYNGFAIRMSAVQASRMSADQSLGAIQITRDRILSLPPNEGEFGVNAKPDNPGGGKGGGNDGGDDPDTGTPPSCAENQTTPWGVTLVTGVADFCAETNEDFSGNLLACVIDTGIDYTHPDLNVRQDLSATFVRRTDDANDDNGHGSHVAGTIGAINNDEGVVGVAPNVELVAIKVLNRRGSGSEADVMAGIEQAGIIGCDVANVSLGGATSSSAQDGISGMVQSVAATKGVIFTLAAGNSSADTNFYTPAKASRVGETANSSTSDRVMTIASMNQSRQWSYFSNYQGVLGADVDFIQPGENIYSTYKNGGYYTANGTSMAAPHAAGLVIRYLSQSSLLPGTYHDIGCVTRAGLDYPIMADRALGTAGGCPDS